MSEIIDGYVADVIKTPKKVKYGSWRKHLNIYETDYTCSECGGIVQDDIYPFCPWCGKPMRKRKESE